MGGRGQGASEAREQSDTEHETGDTRLDKDENAQKQARLPGQQVKQGARPPLDFTLRKGNTSQSPKFILDVGWDILIPPGYSSLLNGARARLTPWRWKWRGHWEDEGAEGVEEGAGVGAPRRPAALTPAQAQEALLGRFRRRPVTAM